jgi:hypothetical protein
MTTIIITRNLASEDAPNIFRDKNSTNSNFGQTTGKLAQKQSIY